MFRLEDWKDSDPSLHNFRKLVLEMRYICQQLAEDSIELDVWVDMLQEWAKNIKHLGKGMNVACKDFEWRAWSLMNNRALLLKHGIITEDSREYKYMNDFMQLEIDLGLHRTNITNNDSEFKKIVKEHKSGNLPQNRKPITEEIA